MRSHTQKKTPIDFRRDIFAIIFLAAGIFISLCLFSYSPTDPAINSASNISEPKNFCGVVGAYLSDILFIVFGIGAYMACAVLFLMSLLQFLGREIRMRVRELLYYCGIVAFSATLLQLRFETVTIHGHAIDGGGIIGELIGQTLASLLNRPGAYIFSTASLLLLFTLATKLSLRTIATGISTAITFCASNIWRWMRAGILWTTDQIKHGAQATFKGISSKIASASNRPIAVVEPEVSIADPLNRPVWGSRKKVDDEEIKITPIDDIDEEEDDKNDEVANDDIEDVGTPPALVGTNAKGNALTGPMILKRADIKQKRASAEQLSFQKFCSEGYEPPPLSLLDADDRKKVEVDEEALKKNSMLVEMKLKDFDVEGKVTAIHPGPVITMYEFEPAAGTKVNKIVGLQDDLSLTLGGRSVRIVPHLPGKAALGIEIPNSEREIVWLKDTIASSQFGKQGIKLPIALGASAAGNPVVHDLSKMPHLLVAGATGSGKSVAINSIIISLLYKLSPDDVRLILVDPKMLELSTYDGIPHLLLPVVTKPKPAIQALRWAVREMERRYNMMANAGTRNIAGYNEKIKKELIDISTEEQALEILAANPDAAVHTGTIPYIVIIIDELADLMMTSSQDIEETITRLAQMARAAGIHLILATQRPSVDVITGLIKANFPARVAFKVTARHDSRTILDCQGAETLLGQGDMLFMSPQGGGLTRIHGSYVTDSDIARVVAHIKQQGEPIYDETILEEKKDSTGGLDQSEEGEDELYDQAIKLVAETKQASISMVQRRLRIGYNRAARMIERMEAEGAIGPADGAKPRQVFVEAQ